jgi:Fic family protein
MQSVFQVNGKHEGNPVSGDDKAYLRTHPWLKFTTRPYLDTNQVKLWWLLGRSCALIDQIAQTPLRPRLAQEMHVVYLTKGAHATTAIEGNSLTEEQVREIIEKKSTLKPSKEYQGQEVRNVLFAFSSITGDVSSGRTPDVSPERIRELNRMVLDKLDVGEGVVPGEWRPDSRYVGSYLAPSRGEVDSLVTQLCDWLASEELAGAGTHRALLRAVLAHLYLEWIHPFGDGNGRTGRLLEFQILLSSGLPTPAAHLLSNHYHLTRTDYYRQLERASKSGGDFMPFLLYALQGLVDGLEEQHERLRADKERLVWRNLVEEELGREHTAAQQRRVDLACTLYELERPLPLSKLPGALVGFPGAYLGMVDWYHDKTVKTLTRDLNALKQRGLVTKGKTGWRACKEIVMGLRPVLDAENTVEP